MRSEMGARSIIFEDIGSSGVSFGILFTPTSQVPAAIEGRVAGAFCSKACIGALF